MEYALPVASGNYGDDNRVGREYAATLVRGIQTGRVSPPEMGAIFRSMIEGGHYGAVEIGFAFGLYALLVAEAGDVTASALDLPKVAMVDDHVHIPA